MNILFLCQYYYPEPFRHNDICEALVQRGHRVTVVTGTPNYPEGEIYPGYGQGAHAEEMINGVRVVRLPLIPRKTGAVYRLLNYYSFVWSSERYLRRCRETFDVVFAYQLSPVMMADAGIHWAKKHGKKVVLYCLDLWPDSLVSGGVGKNSLIYRFFYHVSRRIYRSADVLLASSRAFAHYFKKEFGITGAEYLPQYAEDIFAPEQCRKAENDRLDLMFAGNIGAAQSVDTILEAAKLTRNEPIHWHIVGDGSEYQRLVEKAKELPNVTFYGRRPLSEMPRFYAMADGMLVTLHRDPVISLTLPGKVQSYLAAGKPILAAGDGEIARVIRDADCGLCGKAEDGAALAENARGLRAADLGEKSRNARAYYEVNFQKERFLTRLELALKS